MLSCLRAFMLLLAIPAAVARAQAPAGAPEAQRLFDEAKADLAAGRYADACPKLARSQQLDPQLGTSMHLAYCHEKAGQLEDAWNQFQEALSVAEQRRLRGQPDEREAMGQRHAAAIEPRVSLVTFAVAEPALEGLAIEHDGQSLPKERWTRALAVTPGSHRLVARAPGRREWVHDYTVGNQARVRVEVPPLAADTSAAAVAAQLPPSAEAESPAAVTPEPISDDGPGVQRIAAYVTGGASIVALGFATGFFVAANSAWEDQDSGYTICHDEDPRTTCNYDDNHALEHTIDTNVRNASIALAIGGALAIGAVVLWVTEPEHAERPSVAVSVEPGGAQVWVLGSMF